MVIPLILGALMNTLTPGALQIGGFTTAIATGSSALIGVFLVCMGAGISFRTAPRALKKGVTITLSKFIIGVMGGAACSEEESAIAERVGELIAEKGGILLCGGGSGIMTAVAKGAKNKGGLTIGIMPGSGSNESPPNEYIDIPIFTGMSDGRNSINVKSSDIVIAIAGGAGTLSEIGLALKNDKKVITIGSWDLSRKGETPVGYFQVETAEEAVEMAFSFIAQNQS